MMRMVRQRVVMARGMRSAQSLGGRGSPVRRLGPTTMRARVIAAMAAMAQASSRSGMGWGLAWARDRGRWLLAWLGWSGAGSWGAGGVLAMERAFTGGAGWEG